MEIATKPKKVFRSPQEPRNPNIEGLISNSELAAVLGCSYRTVANISKKDKNFPIVKVGRLCRYRLSDVMAHLDKRD